MRDLENIESLPSLLYKAQQHCRAGNFTGAFKILKPLAEFGCMYSQNNLGLMYSRGEIEGIENFEEAKKWFLHSAVQNLPEAQFNLARAYYNEHTPQSNICSYKWVMIALMNDGFEVKERACKMLHWLLERNISGDDIAKAQYKIGNFYYSEIVDKSLLKASVWFTLAGENGNVVASQLLSKLVLELPLEMGKKRFKILEKWSTTTDKNCDFYGKLFL